MSEEEEQQQLEITSTMADYDSFFSLEDNDEDDGDDRCVNFNLLRLDSFNRRPAHCGCFVPLVVDSNAPSSSNKRRSPDTANAPATIVHPLDQLSKKPKKLFPEGPLQNAAVPSLQALRDRPVDAARTQSVNSVASLRRCFSDPCNPPVASGPGTGCAVDVVPQSPPENAWSTPASKGSASLPPRPPAALRRVVSEPSPSKSFSRSSSSNEMGEDQSPNYKKLKRMKNIMKEMNQWMDEILPHQGISEEEEDNDKVIEVNATNVTKEDTFEDVEEAVSVERIGECLNIHFICPCGKGYQILLAGGNCYYKLI